MVGSNLKREDMEKLWSTKDILGQDEREILVWYHRMNHFTFKNLIKLSKSGIIINRIIKVMDIPIIFGVERAHPR